MFSKFYKVEFPIGTLLELERELNVPLDRVLFELDITDDIQKIILYHGVRKHTKYGRQQIYKQYDNLSKIDKLKVDMKVNGVLLDAFGLGKKKLNKATEVQEEKEIRFFEEYMTEFMYYMVGVVGLSKEEFLKSTPSEVFEIAEAHKKEQEFNFKLNQLSHINAIGLTSSKKFKEINPFKQEDNSKVKKVGKEFREKELAILLGGDSIGRS